MCFVVVYFLPFLSRKHFWDSINSLDTFTACGMGKLDDAGMQRNAEEMRVEKGDMWK